MNRFRGLIALVVASFAIGCAAAAPTAPSSTSGSRTPGAVQLAGTWNLLSLQRAGEAGQPTPSGASYTLTFADDRLSTRADCNVCNGGFTLSGETLTAGPALACTRAACSTISFENAYTTTLSGHSTVTMSSTTLVLSSARGVLRFTR